MAQAVSFACQQSVTFFENLAPPFPEKDLRNGNTNADAARQLSRAEVGRARNPGPPARTSQAPAKSRVKKA